MLELIPPLMPPEWEQSDEPIVDSLFSLRVGPPSRHKGRRNFHLLYAGAARVARSWCCRAPRPNSS